MLTVYLQVIKGHSIHTTGGIITFYIISVCIAAVKGDIIENYILNGATRSCCPLVSLNPETDKIAAGEVLSPAVFNGNVTDGHIIAVSDANCSPEIGSGIFTFQKIAIGD
jgi:hypothetical protein